MTRLMRWLQVVMAASLMGTVFQPGLGCAGKIAKNFNPCGTFLVCDPLEYDLSWYEISDFPDYDVDPTCTIPGLCGANTPFPPTITGTGTGNTATTGTTTTTGQTGF